MGPLDEIVDELYGLDPSEFTARRDAMAADARRAGDRDLAAAVKALRKPSAAAWTVNLMARRRRDEIGRLIDLGGRLRAAQASLSGEQLRALGHQRQQLVSGLARESRQVAARAGRPISEAVQREVQATFEAALADEAAGEATRAGRLVRALERSGLDPVDLAGAVAGGVGAPARGAPAGTAAAARAGAPGPSTRPGDADRAADARPDELARRRAEREDARRRAEQEAVRAEQEAVRAEQEAVAAEERARAAERTLQAAVADHEGARRRQSDAQDSLRALEDQLVVARQAAERADQDERRARRARHDAEADADEAAARARRARADADEARPHR